jgi:diguanylate cyclase (GGDEF)-like protein
MTEPNDTLLERLRAWTRAAEAFAESADRANLPRLRLFGLTVALLNAVHVVWVLGAYQGDTTDAHVSRWREGLVVAHAAMGFAMLTGAALAYATHRRQWAAPWPRVLSVGMTLTGLCFASAIAVVDQWVTPNITPFLLSTVVAAFLVHVRPRDAAVLHLLNASVFAAALGLTQSDAGLLASNRLNAMGVSLAAWGLSVAHWRSYIMIASHQRALAAAHQVLEERNVMLDALARNDGLTGLLNRRTIIEKATDQLARAKRSAAPTAVLLVDIDHFKSINDNHGHPTGDAALQRVAKVLRDHLRVTDELGRFGGEEFLVVLPNTDAHGARVVADKVRRSVEQDAPSDGAVVSLTVSIGGATSEGLPAATFDALYAAADQALYAAKAAGRNQVCFAPGSASPSTLGVPPP